MVEGEEGERLASEPGKNLCSVLVQWCAEAVLAGTFSWFVSQVLSGAWFCIPSRNPGVSPFPPNGIRAVIAVGSLGNHIKT